jgi:TPR repeat protein
VDFYAKAAAQGNVYARVSLDAHDGNADAQHALGFACYAGGAYDEAAVWYGMAAERGDSEAQFIFGGMHEEGRGVPMDARVACEWYRRAAEQGHAEAQFELGIAGQFGILRPGGEWESWYAKAASKGHLGAIRQLLVSWRHRAAELMSAARGSSQDSALAERDALYAHAMGVLHKAGAALGDFCKFAY